MASSEQRRHPRIRRRLPVTIGTRGRIFSAVSEDLSPSGLLIRCAEILQPGTAISGTLEVEGQVLGFGAVVRWSRSASRSNSNETQHSMGLAFLSSPGSQYSAYFERAIADNSPPAGPDGAAKPPRMPPRATPASGMPAVAPTNLPRAASSQSIPAPVSRGAERPPPPVLTPQRAAPTPHPTPVPATGLVPGLVGKIESQTKAADSKAHGASPLAPSSAAVLFEQAAVQAVSGALPSGTQTLGISLKINMNRPPNVMLGAKLEVVATLLSISDDRTLRFQVELREGERVVASGEHQRILVSG